jgi:diketogulonate reductase-like aldo/keto reductase
MIVFGTHKLTPKTIPEAIDAAVNVGFTRFDTAASYRIESEVGTALRNWISEGPESLIEDPPETNERRKARPREELDVTTKIAPKGMISYEAARTSGLSSLEALFPGSLNLKDAERYLDSLLIHWPARSNLAPSDPAHLVARKETYRAILSLRDEGLVRRPGVSNFTVEHLTTLIESLGRTDWPAANQFELHPGLYRTQLPLIDFCRENGIEIQAYSAVGCGALLSDPVVVRLAEHVSTRLSSVDSGVGRDAERTFNVTPAQVLIRWSIQHGFVPLVKSVSNARIGENWAAAEPAWQLDSGEMTVLDKFEETNGTKRFCWDPTIVA